MGHAIYPRKGRLHEAWVSTFNPIKGPQTNNHSFVSRANPKNNNDHIVLGVLTNKPRDFANQMALNLNNGWGIVRTIADMCLKMDDGKYVLVKDPNKSMLRLYSVPENTFEEEIEEAPIQEEEENES
jgi:translation initiation factor 3 subunit D